MRFRSLVSVAILAVLAVSAAFAADLVKFKDWEKSPEFVYLATDADRKAWKDVRTDEQAEKFVALFWARRNPDPSNPANEFKQRFESRVAKADELFAFAKKRGSLTERGKLFVLIGAPKTMAQKVDSSASTPFGSQSNRSTGGGFLGNGGGTIVTYQFLYEKAQLPSWADVQTLDAKFQVDTSAITEHLIDMGEVKRLEKMAVEKALVHPDLTQAPVYKTREQANAEAKSASEGAAEAARGTTLTPAVRTVLEAALAKEAAGPLTVWPLASGETSGQLMLQLLVPAASVSASDQTKLAILVRTKDGKDVARREEPALLQKTKGDFFCDRAIAVAPGEYEVGVALLDGAGAPILVSHRSVNVPVFPAEFAASELILSTNDFPAEGAKLGDPFVFSQRKFVVRGDGQIDGTDGLSYFVRIYNPSFDPTTKKTALKQRIKVKSKNGPPQELPAPPDSQIQAPAGSKEGKSAVDIGYGLVETNIGQYFKGEYVMTVTVTDTISGKSFDLKMPFKVTGAAPAVAPSKKKG